MIDVGGSGSFNDQSGGSPPRFDKSCEEDETTVKVGPNLNSNSTSGSYQRNFTFSNATGVTLSPVKENFEKECDEMVNLNLK